MPSCACSQCQARLQIPDTLFGKQVRCPKCKNAFVVPSGAANAPPPSAGKSTVKPSAAPPEATFEVVGGPVAPEATFTPKKKVAAAPRRAREDEFADFDEVTPIRPKPRPKQAAIPWLLVSIVGGIVGVVSLAALGVVIVVATSTQDAARKEPKERVAVVDAAANAKQGPREKPVAPAPAPVVPAPAPNGAAPVAPAPVVKADPPQQLVEAPKGALPASILHETTQRVKKATTQIRVTTTTGDMGEGSGFFAFEKGLVVSNAHVVGMLHSMEKPRNVDVVINSGEPDEFHRAARVLGVDQEEDLALLQLDGDKESLPVPLVIDHLSALHELQKVYVFGFPFGEQLGKSITVSESSISAFRKSKEGLLQQIQINGGIQPGNSGGPIVDNRGNVIGVSVAIIRGTQINFAVPSEKVHGLSQGRVLATNYGEPYKHDQSVRMPIKISCLDPMSRLKGMKLDLWTGPQGNARPGSPTPPAGAPGDGPKQTVAMTYNLGKAEAEIPLPNIPAGHVLWIQPTLLHSSGKSAWSNAVTVPSASSSPLERQPANLSLNMEFANERTLKLSSKRNVQILEGKKKIDIYQKLDTEILETVAPRNGDYYVRLNIADAKISNSSAGKAAPVNQRALQLFRGGTYGFTIAREGRLKEVGVTTWDKSKIDPFIQADARELVEMLTTGYEATSFNLPQRDTRPMESWRAVTKMLFSAGKKKEIADVHLNCTYEGTRQTGDEFEAFIRIEGELRPNAKSRDSLTAKVTGHVLFDMARGYLSKANVVVRFDIEFGDAFMVATQETTLDRAAGKPRDLKPGPTPAPAPPNADVFAGTGNIIVNKLGRLSPNDPVYPAQNGPYQAVSTPMVEGRGYIIDLTSNGGGYDPFLVLEDPTGAIIAQDDDGGEGLNSRIRIRATKTGQHRIIVTAFNRIAADAAYNLRVTEFGGGPPNPNVAKAPDMPDNGDADRIVKKLPGAFADVALGGNGRYLIFFLPQPRKLAVFEVNTARITGYVSVDDDDVKFAAGMDKLVVGLCSKGLVQCWDLKTLKRELTVQATPGKIRHVAMGHASAGPVLVHSVNNPGNPSERTEFLDLKGLKPIAFKGKDIGVETDGHVRASADGQTFATWRINSSPQGISTLVIEGKNIRRFYDHHSAGYLMPSPDGKQIYTAEGRYTFECKALDDPRNGHAYRNVMLPAVNGNYYLSLVGGENDQVASISLTGDKRPLAILSFARNELPPLDSFGREYLNVDKRLFFIPETKVIITLPKTNDEVVLRRFDIDETLEKSGVDYLIVTSTPPATAKRGAKFEYKLTARAKKGGLTYSLESGPEGMKISPMGVVTWTVPADDAVRETSVIIAVRDAAGQETFHTFALKLE